LRLLEETVSRKSFDRFIRAYIEKFRFSSIGTDELVSFINEYFEGLPEKVDADKWLYKPGIPENCPKIYSSRLEYIKNLSDGFKFGTYPTKEEIGLMKPAEKLVYFQGLPKKLSEEECQFLEKNFELREMTNAEILSKWFIISATSNYKPTFKMIRNFLLEVGRMKFVKPIYKAMGTNKETRQLAKEIFEITKESLHPLTRTVVEQEISNYEKD
jgi:hypothetical protein